ncbi:transcription factor Pcc1-domain-containing protein [Exophiala viscosa]|uniref:Transcription factor Pcc1-domain-containing protein n=1 Tax=Exophiala viscosa TaxID=2486360 RepID=A0AAN6DXF0_9EURO|nr:transcription factor Pcc1-domain-containing protein [Exophiala viscosa]KAI1626355.1 transcription factor Pcc1-domain-containing protein [Exophiala viscosa]
MSLEKVREIMKLEKATDIMKGFKSDSSEVIDVPLLNRRLASSAMRALRVDAELSPLVRRKFSMRAEDTEGNGKVEDESYTILRTEYSATTNRMLRVAVNGFMESLGVVLQVMEELDVDVLESQS